MQQLTAMLNYQIPKGDGGRVFVYGESVENAQTIVIFCAGFPDDTRVFQPLAMRLASSRVDMVCGVTCLPGYDRCQDCEKAPGGGQENYDMDDMARSIQEATKALKAHVPAATRTVGVFHDWGCFAGSTCANLYTDFDALVYIDVLPTPQGVSMWKRGFSLKQACIMPLYTSLYAFTYAIQRYVSGMLSRIAFAIGGSTLMLTGSYPVKKVDFKTLKNHYKKEELYSHKTISMMYPYYQMYRNVITGQPIFGKASFLNVLTPTLFIFGQDKRIHFHTSRDIAWMGQYSHMKVVAVERAGHWLYLQEPDIAFNDIDIFLKGI